MKRVYVASIVVVPLFCLGFVWAGPASRALGQSAGGNQSQEPNAPVALSLPTQWVPFTADVRHTSPGGEILGKWYRSENGSQATYIYNGPKTAITIHNTQTRLTYWCYQGSGNVWNAAPIRLKAIEPPKPVMKSNKLRLLPEAVGGFEIYELVNGKHLTRIVPALNGLVVLSMAEGTGRELFNIVVGEPPADLFVPPPGVPIRRVPTAPGGTEPERVPPQR